MLNSLYHLFCISSPFQADSARRAIEHLGLPLDKVIILLFDNAFRRDFISVRNSLGDVYNNAHVKNIDYKTNSLSRRLSFVKKEAPSSSFVVYVGDWNNKLPKFFAFHPRFKSFKAIDDGVATFAIAERVQRSHKWYNFFKRFKPDFVTRYEIKSLCPSFSVELIPVRKNPKKLNKSALFVGCSAVEKNIMREEDYLYALERVNNLFPDHDWIYYPHRYEEKRELPVAFDVVSPQLPIEVWLESLTTIPCVVVTLFSSALVNIKSEYPDVDAYYYEVDPEFIFERKEDIVGFYKKLEEMPEYHRLY